MADDQTFHDDIEAYCTPQSVVADSAVGLHVSTRSSRFDVVVERWGATRREVWRADALPGRYLEPPPDADEAGCGWPVSVEIPVDASWTPGFHLVTLIARDAPAGRDRNTAWFVVRNATPSGTLLVLDTNTWNAYNTWGGRSLYTGGSTVSFDRPLARGMLERPDIERDDRKARPVRWGEEPDADGRIFQAYRTENAFPSAIGSAGWFTHARRFVEWAERDGHEIDLAISTDPHDDSALFDGYDLVMSVGHDEYWSAPQREAIETHVRRGGTYAAMSGNTMFWQVRIEGGPAGAASLNMVCHKYAAHVDDPVVADGRPEEMSGMWCDPLVAHPEWRLLGAGSAFGLYHRFGNATARGVGGYLVYRPDHWLVDGTGLRYGDVLGATDGVVGYETVGLPITFDEFQQPVPIERADLPDDIEIVGHVPSSNLGVGDYPASIAALSDQGDLEFLATRLYGDDSDASRRRVRNGNSLMLTCRPFGSDGGEVVTIGTTDWVFGLASDAAVQQVTSNVLSRTHPTP
ncbi:MAG: N,N-dimethylformamidase beta subunit family domain-containing protein [Ilumatobacter sp.]